MAIVVIYARVVLEDSALRKMLCIRFCEENDFMTDYIGGTKRPLRLRYNEHLRDMIGRKEDTPMGDHFRMAHPQADHTPPPFEVSVLYRRKTILWSFS